MGSEFSKESEYDRRFSPESTVRSTGSNSSGHDHFSSSFDENTKSSRGTSKLAQILKSGASTFKTSTNDPISGHLKKGVLAENDVQKVLLLAPKLPERLQLLHEVVTETSIGFFRSPVDNMLESGATVLDIGCGTGQWSLEMAQRYPNSAFVGIDQTEVMLKANTTPRPPNFYFRQADVFERWPFPDEHFDFIFCRFMGLVITMDKMGPHLQEILRVLRPGGYVEFIEPDFEFCNSGPIYNQLYKSLYHAMYNRGLDITLVYKMGNILRDHSSLNFVNSDYISLPVAWDGPVGNNVKVLIGLGFYITLSVILSEHLEMTNEDYGLFVRTALEECATRKSYFNLHWAYGKKSVY